MRIGVISDTHLRSGGRGLPAKLLEGLEGADLILHAGDWMTLDILYELEAVAPVEGVAGNNDGFDIIDRFGFSKILELNGFRIGLTHGHQGYKQTPLNALDAFKDEAVDTIVFGHSHIPFNKDMNGIRLFNPGSPTDKRRQPQYSYGFLYLDEVGKEMTAEILYL